MLNCQRAVLFFTVDLLSWETNGFGKSPFWEKQKICALQVLWTSAWPCRRAWGACKVWIGWWETAGNLNFHGKINKVFLYAVDFLYEHYERNQFDVRSLYWRSGSRKKCRGTTTPTSQFAMLTVSVTFWAHSLMISWKVTPTSYLELINAFKGRFVLTLSHATQNILSWYAETARTLILIWMSATITYIPNYIIYPMYIAIFGVVSWSFHP